MRVRAAEIVDLDSVAALFDRYRQFYGQPSDIAGARDFINSRLSRGESMIFLAEREGRAVGFTQLYPSFSSVSMGPILILNDLFVGEEARGQGVGRALLAAAAAYGKEKGALRLALSTARDNVTAQRLYEAEGWLRDSAYFHYDKPL